MNITDTKTLNNGVEMPIFGLGVFLSQAGDETTNAVACALSQGYRLIDTATAYQNEEFVGEGIKKAAFPAAKFLSQPNWGALRSVRTDRKNCSKKASKSWVRIISTYI